MSTKLAKSVLLLSLLVLLTAGFGGCQGFPGLGNHDPEDLNQWVGDSFIRVIQPASGCVSKTAIVETVSPTDYCGGSLTASEYGQNGAIVTVDEAKFVSQDRDMKRRTICRYEYGLSGSSQTAEISFGAYEYRLTACNEPVMAPPAAEETLEDSEAEIEGEDLEEESDIEDTDEDEGELMDSDEDGISDDDDNCPDNPNPAQEDADKDGLGDVCDVTPFLESDSDGDGIDDEDDNCPDMSNADQSDKDDDGLGDLCDDTPEGDVTDVDGDEVADDDDNCLTIPNPEQTDQDNDGLGDACDDTPNGEEETVSGEPIPVTEEPE